MVFGAQKIVLPQVILMSLKHQAGEHICASAIQGRRPYMEDTLLVQSFFLSQKQEVIFYGVFDGHGGSSVSKQLVHPVSGLFGFLFRKMTLEGTNNLPSLLREGFLQYDFQLFQRRQKFRSGSTAIIALIFQKKLYLVKTGDSEGIIFTSEKYLADSRQYPHKPDHPSEQVRIERAGSQVVFDRSGLGGPPRVDGNLALSRAFGDFEFKVQKPNTYLGTAAAVSVEPVVIVIDLKAQQTPIYLFLASDGFWDMVADNTQSNQALKTMLSTNLQSQQMCQGLVNKAYQKGSTDNISVLFDRVV